jgi:hypothetical protein
VCRVLADGELFGRSLLELEVSSLDQVVVIDAGAERKALPHDLPIGGVISLPLADDMAEVHQGANQWRGDIGRAAGLAELR